MAFVMARAMGTSGAESMSAAANIFLGQTEAPLVVKPYVARMTHSELMAIMTGGFATVAGGVMAAYVGMLKDYFPDIAGHLMAASIMNAPAGLLLAKLMQPEVEEPETADTSSSGDARRSFAEVLVDLVTLRFLARTWRAIRAEEKPYPNVIGAAAGGAADGMSLVLNVAAMLLAFIALIALLNAGVVWLTGLTGHPLSINEILGAVLGPVAWLMGVPWSEAGTVASLLGEKAVLNEFIAYTHLGELCRNTPHVLSERTVAITTYALLGFANFSSIGIQIGGIGGIAPNRRSDLARLGLRAMIGGTLAAYISACIAAMMLG
jgi:CNT family concentrative nucleoside transporter